ncbi:MAG: hypothetical protein WA432_04195 [Candidatus Babeliaceae bacterium]
MLNKFSVKSFLLMGCIFFGCLNASSLSYLDRPDERTRLELLKSAARAFGVSFFCGFLTGPKDKPYMSRGMGVVCAAGGNFVLGNLMFQERDYPVQVACGVLGFLVGTLFSHNPLF